MKKHYERPRRERCYSFPQDMGALESAPCDRKVNHHGKHTNGKREWWSGQRTSQPMTKEDDAAMVEAGE